MSGMEAWGIVAPILAAHTVHRNGDSLNALDEAYVITFGALKQFDDQEEQKREEEKAK